MQILQASSDSDYSPYLRTVPPLTIHMYYYIIYWLYKYIEDLGSKSKLICPS